MSRQFVRSIKNISYSPTEVKVRNMTSNDPWGPSGSDLDQISKLTFQHEKLKEIIKILNKRLSIRKNSALHILKSLTIIQYCLQVGSQDFVDYFKIHPEVINALIDYDITNKTNKEAVNVRKRSRYIMKLLKDDALLVSKRENFHKLRSEMLIPGIKSTENDKFKHMRYSLDQRSNDLQQEEILSNFPAAQGQQQQLSHGSGRSTSLDIKRLNYYKRNSSRIADDRSNTRLQFIREETTGDDENANLQQKIDTFTNSGNPFRNSIFGSTGGGSNSSSASSLSDMDKKNYNPFLQPTNLNH